LLQVTSKELQPYNAPSTLQRWLRLLYKCAGIAGLAGFAMDVVAMHGSLKCMHTLHQTLLYGSIDLTATFDTVNTCSEGLSLGGLQLEFQRIQTHCTLLYAQCMPEKSVLMLVHCWSGGCAVLHTKWSQKGPLVLIGTPFYA
jgi:hypothetical protein